MYKIGWLLRLYTKQLFFLILGFSLIWQQVFVAVPVEAASIAHRATSQNDTGGSASSITINKPAGTIQGDIMILNLGFDSSATVTATGWTLIKLSTNSAVRIASYYKVATGSEGSSYTFTFGNSPRSAGGISTYSGVDTSNPIDVTGASNSGSGTSLTGLGVTTNTSNTLLIFAGATSSGSGVATTFTPPAGMTERVDRGSGGILSDISATADEQAIATPSATGNKTATAAASGTWAAHLYALNNEPAPNLNLSAYRFSVNADNTTPAYITDNLSANNDTISGTVNDTVNSVFYTVGDNSSNWVIEKRRIADGALCTSTNCGTTFGTGGRITEDVASSTTEKAFSVAVDPSAGSIYVVGMDQVTTNTQWRVEKRDMLTGNLDTSFSGDGIVQSNPTSGTDEANTIAIDTTNDYIYVGGYDSTSNNEWRIEKYRMSDGAICTAANCGTAFATNGVYTNNLSAGDDSIKVLSIDPTNNYLFVAGQAANGGGSKKQWTLYKMRADNSNLCTAANCGTAFDTDGIYTSDPDNARDDQLLDLQVDAAADAIYLGGYEATSASAVRWRIEKISMSTGARDGTFNNSACNAGTGNSVCASFSSGEDKVVSLELDGAGGYIYILGVMDEGATDSQWRLQKRQRSDGALVSGWASSGTASVNPAASQKDPPSKLVIDVDRGLLWATGGDRTLSSTNMQWYFTQLQLDTGTTWLAAQDTVAGVSTLVTFRLRLLLHASTQTLRSADARQYKLQYAQKVGTCDTGFIGESYADVSTSSGEIRYHDNPSISDAATAVAVSGDPAHSTDSTVLETIEESNNFTNPTDVISNTQDGLWDFILKDSEAFGAYCFKVVKSDGSDISTYTVIPEITFCKDDPKTNAQLRHGTYFCEGQKKSFFWAKD